METSQLSRKATLAYSRLSNDTTAVEEKTYSRMFFALMNPQTA